MTNSSTAAQEGWRTVDIVVTAVLGVAFGVVFAGWNVLTSALFSGAVNPPAYLVQNGWKSTSVKMGDKVKVTARPFMDGQPGGLFVSVTLADGKVLGSGAQPSNTQQAPPAQPGPPPQR